MFPPQAELAEPEVPRDMMVMMMMIMMMGKENGYLRWQNGKCRDGLD